jgi:hypothetical protein
MNAGTCDRTVELRDRAMAMSVDCESGRARYITI